jgi:DNA-binding NarL/FixJ family response regulator
MPGNRQIELILFVDDDPAFLDALQVRLASLDDHWRMAFSTGGDDAIQQLESEDFSVVVSDIDNRHLDGEAFMEVVRQRAPNTARVIMSTKADTARLHHVADSEHFYLSKGCSLQQFVAAIEEAIELHRFLQCHPRELSNQQLTEVIVDYFTREVMRQKICIDDIPEQIRPYITRELLKQAQSGVQAPYVEQLDNRDIIDAAWPETD